MNKALRWPGRREFVGAADANFWWSEGRSRYYLSRPCCFV